MPASSRVVLRLGIMVPLAADLRLIEGSTLSTDLCREDPFAPAALICIRPLRSPRRQCNPFREWRAKFAQRPLRHIARSCTRTAIKDTSVVKLWPFLARKTRRPTAMSEPRPETPPLIFCTVLLRVVWLDCTGSWSIQPSNGSAKVVMRNKVKGTAFVATNSRHSSHWLGGGCPMATGCFARFRDRRWRSVLPFVHNKRFLLAVGSTFSHFRGSSLSCCQESLMSDEAEA
eukprot:CAMPEP_0119338110 /NCGR_PEP_ID=MMETSP1333-20130426/95357_1 /TAXON_ID=418940 /ORGANISM="Scyphosphaera apsteinii, Strain RCC1455" /LENGTH=229 /DNA_ID=CAMNT_0007349313 /DNA_START=213 /DNA_END=902 /DNA_ORIENTATION=+